MVCCLEAAVNERQNLQVESLHHKHRIKAGRLEEDTNCIHRQLSFELNQINLKRIF